MHGSEKGKWSHSVVSDSLWPHGLQPSRLLCPWDFPGKSFPIPFLWGGAISGHQRHCWICGSTVSMGSGCKKLQVGLRLLWQHWCWLHTSSHPGFPYLITRINNCLNSHMRCAFSRLEFFLSLSNKSINLFYFGFSKTQMVEERETRKEIVLF